MRHPKRQLQGWIRKVRGSPAFRSLAEGLRVPSPLGKAIFNFTVDFELAWGNGKLEESDHPIERRWVHTQRQAQVFGPFIGILKRLRMPTSWALLGRLAYPDLVPKDASLKFAPRWAQSDWYDLDARLRKEPELWDGRPYLEALKQLPGIEFLSHGHAHIDYADPATTEAIAREDLRLAREAFRSQGIEPRGFVFPCNESGHLSLVAEQGFPIIRGSDVNWNVPVQGPIQTPRGFWISPGIFSTEEMVRAVDLAIEHRSLLHPWMHLIECDPKCRDLQEFYEPFFRYVLKKQEQGAIECVSFGSLAARIHRGGPP